MHDVYPRRPSSARVRAGAVLLGCLPLVAACSSSPNDASATGAPCPTGGLPSVAYDISKSRIAFGGSPVRTISPGGDVIWTGPDGLVSIAPDGEEDGSVNEDSPQANLPPATTDFATEEAYARDYFVTMGVPSCELEAGSVDIDQLLYRAVHGVVVVESLADARFDNDYQTTHENFYWPAIPASVVSQALAFQSMLASPAALAAFKRKLPTDAQGGGHVVIHHTPVGSTDGVAFEARTTYDVESSGDVGDGNPTLSFDSDGHPVTLAW